MANLIFTIPINIGGSNETVPTYPPPDESLRRYLVEEVPDDENGCSWHYLAFFNCLFYFISKELDRWSTGSSPKPSQSEFACMWRSHLDDRENRNRIYASVVDTCCATRVDFRVLRNSTISWLAGIVEKLNHHCVGDDTQKVKIVLYIDEAQELKVPLRQGNNSQGLTPLDILCTILDVLHEQPLYGLVISTQPLLHGMYRASD